MIPSSLQLLTEVLKSLWEKWIRKIQLEPKPLKKNGWALLNVYPVISIVNLAKIILSISQYFSLFCAVITMLLWIFFLQKVNELINNICSFCSLLWHCMKTSAYENLINVEKDPAELNTRWNSEKLGSLCAFYANKCIQTTSANTYGGSGSSERL